MQTPPRESWRYGPSPLDCLVFSRDRAPQLDLLLRSIAIHAPNLYSTVWVLYVASSMDHRRGYQRCWVENSRHEGGFRAIPWQEERSFADDVRNWLGFAGELVSFLVDDDVFYRPAPALAELEPLVPVSLRGGDYDYPFSLDGNIYRRDDVEQLLEGLEPRDPTELEWFAHERRRRLPFDRVNPCPGGPCLVGIPANRVSPTSAMPHMGIDTEALLALYLAGGRLELPAGLEDLPAHAELELAWAPA